MAVRDHPVKAWGGPGLRCRAMFGGSLPWFSSKHLDMPGDGSLAGRSESTCVLGPTCSILLLYSPRSFTPLRLLT